MRPNDQKKDFFIALESFMSGREGQAQEVGQDYYISKIENGFLIEIADDDEKKLLTFTQHAEGNYEFSDKAEHIVMIADIRCAIDKALGSLPSPTQRSVALAKFRYSSDKLSSGSDPLLGAILGK